MIQHAHASTSRRPPRRLAWPGKRRELMRHTFFANARVMPLDGRRDPAHGVTGDLSIEGVFVHCAAGVGVGSLILLQLYSPLGTFRGLALVVRQTSDGSIGCRFLDMDELQYRDLCHLIAERSSARRTQPRTELTF